MAIQNFSLSLNINREPKVVSWPEGAMGTTLLTVTVGYWCDSNISPCIYFLVSDHEPDTSVWATEPNSRFALAVTGA